MAETCVASNGDKWEVYKDATGKNWCWRRTASNGNISLVKELFMKLDEFVKQTLLDITNGVALAQEEALLYIAPGYVENKKQTEPQNVQFEVAVTAAKEASAGIRVLSFGEAKGGGSSEQVNRISFAVPVYLQAPTEKNPKQG